MNLNKLDEDQKAAVLAEDKVTLVCAAPGAGKTTVLIYRAAYLINEKAVPGKSIAIITFTKAAAENIEKRFNSFVSTGSRPFIGTFHSFFYHIINEKRNIKIIDEALAAAVIKCILKKYTNVFSEHTVKEVINYISKYKNYSFGIHSSSGFKPPIDESIFMECYNYYEHYKLLNCLMDFEDLQIEALKLIESQRMKNTFIKTFKHMLIDEFQDTDSLEIGFLKIMSKTSSIYAVGDEDQSIYSFRNARPDCMVNFQKYFPIGKKMFLNINYRCPSNITSLSEKIIRNNLNRNDKAIFPKRKDVGGIFICNCSDEMEAAERAAYIIDKGSYGYNDYALLFRTRYEARVLIDKFVSRNIPFTLFNDIYSVYNHFLYRDIICYFKIALDDFNAEAFASIVNKPQRYISKLHIEKLKEYKYKVSCFDYLLYEAKLNNSQKLNVLAMKFKTSRLKNMKPLNAAKYILKNIGYENYIKELIDKNKIDSEEIKLIKDELLMSISEFETVEGIIRHADKTEEILKRNERHGVNVSTIHGIKGMEYKNIIIMNTVDGIIPYMHKNVISDLEEERRLFYVAVTRTINNLHVIIPNRLKGIEVKNSRFVEECEGIK